MSNPGKPTVSSTELSAEARAAAYYEARAAAANAKARVRQVSSREPPWNQGVQEQQSDFTNPAAPPEVRPLKLPAKNAPSVPVQRPRDSPRAKWGAAAVPEIWVESQQPYSPSNYTEHAPREYHPDQYEPSPAHTQPYLDPSPELAPLPNEPPTPTSELQLTEALDSEMRELKLRVAELSRRGTGQEAHSEIESTVKLSDRVRASMEMPPRTPDKGSSWEETVPYHTTEAVTPGWRNSVLMPDTPTSIDDPVGTPTGAGWSSQIEIEIAEGLDREIAELKLRVNELSKRANQPEPVPTKATAAQQKSEHIAAARGLLGQMDEPLFERCLAEANHDLNRALDYYGQCLEHQRKVQQQKFEAAQEQAWQEEQARKERQEEQARKEAWEQQQKAQQQKALQEKALQEEQARQEAWEQQQKARQEEQARQQEQTRQQEQARQEAWEQEQARQEAWEQEQARQEQDRLRILEEQRLLQERQQQLEQQRHQPSSGAARRPRSAQPVDGMTPAMAAKVAAVQAREDRRRDTLERAAAIREERRRERQLAEQRAATPPTEYPNEPVNNTDFENVPIRRLAERHNPQQPVSRAQQPAHPEFELEFEPQTKHAGFGKPPPINTKSSGKRQAVPKKRRAASAAGKNVAGARRHSLPDSPTRPSEAGVPLDERPIARPSSSNAAPKKPTHKRTSSNDGVATRINFDKRTSRHKNASHFASAVQRYRQKRDASKMVPVSADSGRRIWVCVRKRPLFDYEASKGEYDCITMYPSVGHAVVHNCQMYADMYRMYVKHEDFVANAAYDEHTDTSQVYTGCTQHLVDLAVNGGISTVFMYGQTGSGKTYTMKGLQRLAAEDIFNRLGEGANVVVSFFEIAGKALVDLIQPSSSVELRQDAEGTMRVCGAAQIEVQNPVELLTVLEAGEARRATHGTDVNSVSSRSHAVLRLEICTGGTLLLIDCAGSERKEDSMMHSAARRKEGAQINSSLHALKECFRAMREGNQHVPFRGSQLTKVLQETFTRDDAMTMVLATLSPTPTDIEHSISTLRTVCMLAGTDHLRTEIKEDVPQQCKRRG